MYLDWNFISFSSVHSKTGVEISFLLTPSYAFTSIYKLAGMKFRVGFWGWESNLFFVESFGGLRYGSISTQFPSPSRKERPHFRFQRMVDVGLRVGADGLGESIVESLMSISVANESVNDVPRQRRSSPFSRKKATLFFNARLLFFVFFRDAVRRDALVRLGFPKPPTRGGAAAGQQQQQQQQPAQSHRRAGVALAVAVAASGVAAAADAPGAGRRRRRSTRRAARAQKTQRVRRDFLLFFSFLVGLAVDAGWFPAFPFWGHDPRGVATHRSHRAPSTRIHFDIFFGDVPVFFTEFYHLQQALSNV